MDTHISLKDRMKEYENTDIKLDNSRPIIVRVDGKKFSTYTRGFDKPYDIRIHNAMRQTCEDIMREFHPAFVYSQSDEISFMLLPGSTGEMFADGRVVKISSLAAGFTSSRFNFHIMKQDTAGLKDNVVNRVQNARAYFDGRALNLPENEVLNYIVFRGHHDARRNSILNYAYSKFPQNELHKLNTIQIKDKLLLNGHDWESLPEWYKLGFFYKFENTRISGINPRTYIEYSGIRSTPKMFTREITKWTETDNDWLFAKQI
jgi:tRNA(His) 5'-end guanylyltransferase